MDWAEFIRSEWGMPHVDWDGAYERIHERGNPVDSVDAILRMWFAELAPWVEGKRRQARSKSFRLLSPYEDATGNLILAHAERVVDAIRTDSPLRTVDLPAGPIGIVVFRNASRYDEFLRPYFPHGHWGIGFGVFTRCGHPVIALPDQELDELEVTLTHELAHVAMARRRYPYWIEEALATQFDRLQHGVGPPVIETRRYRVIARAWRQMDFESFACGEGWDEPERYADVWFDLAWLLLWGLFLEDATKFESFVADADAADGGEKAARRHFGSGLEERIRSIVAPYED
jgi:hypothetical protein